MSRLEIGWLTFPVVLLAGRTGPGDPVDRAGSGEAEFGGPAFDVLTEAVPLVQVVYAGLVGEDHGGDGAVAWVPQN